MDVQQLLADAPINTLLGLLSIPACGALLLVGYLAFTFSRRSKNSKMKLGTAPTDEPTQAPAAPPTPPAEAALDLNVLRGIASPPPAPAAKPQPPVQSPVVAAVTPPAVEPDELLRLLRDPATGQLLVDVAGRRYTKLSDIADKKIGQYVLKLMAHLLVFSNGVIVTEAGLKSVYNPKEAAGSVPMPLAKVAPPSTPMPAKPAAKPEPLVPPPSPEAEAAFLAALRANSLGDAGKTGSSRPSPAAKPALGLNLADEINDIVQTRLRYTPLANSPRIEITSNQDGGILITVNGRQYSSPDDIPNPEIKNLIKQAIKEWERS